MHRPFGAFGIRSRVSPFAGVGVFLHAAFLEPVEFLAGLAVQILTVHDEEAFLNVGIVLQVCRRVSLRTE